MRLDPTQHVSLADIEVGEDILKAEPLNEIEGCSSESPVDNDSELKQERNRSVNAKGKRIEGFVRVGEHVSD